MDIVVIISEDNAQELLKQLRERKHHHFRIKKPQRDALIKELEVLVHAAPSNPVEA